MGRFTHAGCIERPPLPNESDHYRLQVLGDEHRLLMPQSRRRSWR